MSKLRVLAIVVAVFGVSLVGNVFADDAVQKDKAVVEQSAPVAKSVDIVKEVPAVKAVKKVAPKKYVAKVVKKSEKTEAAVEAVAAPVEEVPVK